ncbi:MAG: SBBP repeat-containing protein, partial [Actinomycetota bacterium]
VIHRAPTIFQQTGGERVPVEGGFVRQGHTVRFSVGAYDQTAPLIIDPVTDLAYSTYIGASGADAANAVAVDATKGNVYLIGRTADVATDFPTTPGASQGTHGGATDVFVVQMEPDNSGTAPDATDLVYSTFIGGTGGDVGRGIALGVAGNALVTGVASLGFPTTASGFDTTFNGGSTDAFVAMIQDIGGGATNLLYSTFLGSSAADAGNAIAVDPLAQDAYVTGETGPTGGPTPVLFPTTTGAFDTAHNGGTFDAFFAKVDPDVSGAGGLLYSTFLGGDAEDRGLGITFTSTTAFITGFTQDGATVEYPVTTGAFDTTPAGVDAFFSSVTPAGGGTTDLAYSTLVGGSVADIGRGIAVDGSGNAHLTGETLDGATDMPTTAGAFQTTHAGGTDAFYAKIAPAGGGPTDQLYTTFLGAAGTDIGRGIAVDPSGNAHITGETGAPGLPTSADPFDPTHNGLKDAFYSQIAP